MNPQYTFVYILICEFSIALSPGHYLGCPHSVITVPVLGFTCTQCPIMLINNFVAYIVFLMCHEHNTWNRYDDIKAFGKERRNLVR